MGEPGYSRIIHFALTKEATGFWVSPAWPCQRKQALSALLALGEHLERKVHTDPPDDVCFYASPSPSHSLPSGPCHSPQWVSLFQLHKSPVSAHTLWPLSFLSPSKPRTAWCHSASRLGTRMQQTPRRTQECIFSSILITRSTLQLHKPPPTQMAGLCTHSTGTGLHISQALQLHRSTHVPTSLWGVGSTHP